MKLIFTVIATCIVGFMSAQEAGKRGELLQNQASKKEMQTLSTTFASGDNYNSDVSNNRDSSYNQNSTTRSSYDRGGQQYNWNQSFGYAEVFLRIPEGGYYTVEIGNQVISNGTGKFRFFDLNSGRMVISIYSRGYLVYRTQLNVRYDTRMVLDYFSSYGLYLLDSYPVRGKQYGFNQWDDVWNNPYNNGNTPWNEQVVYPGNTVVMEPAAFNSFVDMLKKTASFDKDKLNLINQQASVAMFTSLQIKTLLKTMTFDDYRVDAGKTLYYRCVDLANFYQVYESFDFDSGKKKLMNAVAQKK
ncbi:MAG: DUF4476 domain-containing protein [Flavobacteriaceae bacterium]|jgi:hypothetical protein|nr:DUF4476 domain-containing protein [Flavobacteriaceae bacterium]